MARVRPLLRSFTEKHGSWHQPQRVLLQRPIIFPIMQPDIQQGVLRKRLTILQNFLINGKSERSLTVKLAETAEIRRLQVQIELQSMALCRVLKLLFIINYLSDEECLIKFRFMRKYVGFISELIPWDKFLDERALNANCAEAISY
jgi:hypothetical protein